MNIKRCSKCKLDKYTDEFYKDKRTSDGLFSNCKKCSIKYSLNWINNHKKERNILSRIWQRKNRESVNKTHKNWRKKNKTKVLLSYEKYRKNNKLKCEARSCLNNAVRDGKMKRPDICELCNENVGQKNIRADHYNGYDRPNWLNVHWICIKCDSKQLRIYK